MKRDPAKSRWTCPSCDFTTRDAHENPCPQTVQWVCPECGTALDQTNAFGGPI